MRRLKIALCGIALLLVAGVAVLAVVDVEPARRPLDWDATVKPKRASPAPAGHELGRMTDRYGFVRAYLVLPKGLSDEEFLEIARKWHGLEPKTWFWFLDDDARAEQLMASLPETAEGDRSNYPLDWVKAHSVGHIQMELLPEGGKRWVLMDGATMMGEPLAVFESN